MNFLPNIPDRARLWFYLSDRTLNQEEVQAVNEVLSDFVSSWKAHGAQLSADFEVIDGQVIIIAVDEAAQNATGCSIDSQVHLMKELGTKLGVDFFDRHLAAIKKDGAFKTYRFNALQQAIDGGEITLADLVLDNLAVNAGALRESGLKPLKDAWQANLISA